MQLYVKVVKFHDYRVFEKLRHIGMCITRLLGFARKGTLFELVAYFEVPKGFSLIGGPLVSRTRYMVHHIVYSFMRYACLEV